MKNLLLILIATIICNYTMAQQTSNNWDNQWQQVEKLQEKNAIKDALKLVDNILASAKKSNSKDQKIKAICYQQLLQKNNQEGNVEKTIGVFTNQINTTSGAEQQVWHSLLADVYVEHYQNYRWQSSNRTKLQQAPTNINEWTADNYYDAIMTHYMASIANEKTLQNTPITTFKAIIQAGKNTDDIYINMYEVLMDKAIAFFANPNIEITKPSYSFSIDANDGFAEADKFIKNTIKTSDVTSAKYKVLELYKQLLSYYKFTNNVNGFIATNNDRLAFVNNHTTGAANKKLYEQALQNVYDNNKSNKYACLALIKKAELIQDDVTEMNFEDEYKQPTKQINRRLEGNQICKQIIESSTNKYVIEAAKKVLANTNLQTLQLKTEHTYLPNENILANICYRNCNKVYIYIIPKKNKLIVEYDNEVYNYKKICKGIEPIQMQLPNSTDLLNHSIDIQLPALPIGQYDVVVKNNDNWSTDSSVIMYTTINVSNLAYIIAKNNKNQKDNIIVVNRKTGAGIANATVNIYTQEYNNKTNQYDYKKQSTSTTNTNYMCKANIENGLIEIITEKDRYVGEHNHYFTGLEQENTQVNDRVIIFTDKNIYRPQQTVFYKLIYLQEKIGKKTKLLKNQIIEVTLQDANGQVVTTQQVTTNNYGSAAGQFVLPTGQLTGQYTITSNYGSTYFMVEEYKKPKFEIIANPITKTYIVNDKIAVTGVVKAFAGNALPNAAVKYTVVRKPRLLYDWCRWPGWGRQQQEMQITDGTCTTNATGEYNIEFTAIPDDEIDEASFPVFDYTINIDVTDINGETQTNQTTISVGYQALVLNAFIPEAIITNDKEVILVTTKNTNGVFVASTVNISCDLLQTNTSNKKPKLWPTPDQFNMSEKEFAKNFPNDEYTNETNYKFWKTEKNIFTKTITTTADGKITINELPNEDAYIRWKITTKDKNGKEIKDIQYTRLYKNNNAKPIGKETILFTKTNKPNELYIAAANNCNHIIELQTSQIINSAVNWLQSNQINTTNTYTVNKTDKQGRQISLAYYCNNRYYTNTQTLLPAIDDEKIKINILTFRDKIQPGSQQQWTVQITGNNKQQVEAEVLTAMYDASLDALYKNNWPNLEQENGYTYSLASFENCENGLNVVNGYSNYYAEKKELLIKSKLINYYVQGNTIVQRVMYGSAKLMATSAAVENKAVVSMDASAPNSKPEEMSAKSGTFGWQDSNNENSKNQNSNTTIRKNFKETAFWFPQLNTDKNGNISFSFTTPDALTKWRWRMFAHTQDVNSVYKEQQIVTQKELMLVTNNTRFYRTTDAANYTTKIVNMATESITGQVEINILDAETEQNLNTAFGIKNNSKEFSTKAAESVNINFAFEIPTNHIQPIIIQTVATGTTPSGVQFSDGEKNLLPVLINRQLVTETKSVIVRGGDTKKVTVPNLLQPSATQSAYNYCIETTTNPIWYAVQSLPYLMQFPYECAEQTFNKYFANKISANIIQQHPTIATTIASWANKDTNALKSNLQKNQELKSVLLQETPWVVQAKTETEQKQQLVNLLDKNNTNQEAENLMNLLKNMQNTEGGFAWYKGMHTDNYITQYILTGFGKLQKMHSFHENDLAIKEQIVTSGLLYTDRKIVENYKKIIAKKSKSASNNWYAVDELQYLYMRSFFTDYTINAVTKTAINYYLANVGKTIFTQPITNQAMFAIAANRFGKTAIANQIVKGLLQNAITTADDGMYWKNNSYGYFWHQAPIETQCLLIECFNELTINKKAIDEMKIWLINNKQTNNWASTKATAEAIYALVNTGNNFLASNSELQIKYGNNTINTNQQLQESGTGYAKTIIAAKDVTPKMGELTFTNNTKSAPIAYGAVYYQYFENLDKIKASNSDMEISKQIMIVTNTAQGEVLKNSTVIKTGDKIRVRILLKISKDMDYVHLKDMRAACFEPINVLSTYKYQNGLGYYESTKDVATHFFFDHITKGNYVFEYDMFATNKGVYSNGIANIECMYAPQFSAHSEGVIVTVQ